MQICSAVTVVTLSMWLSFAQALKADEPVSQVPKVKIASDGTAQSIDELKAQLEKILKDSHTPGLSVAIVHHDKPEWVAGLGVADVAANRPATSKTLFRIGSVSKGFVSLSILKLVNEGKLSLMDPVHKLAPEVWFENKWEDTDPVRVVDLLEHTTGWDDIHLREYAKDAPATMSLREALDYDHHSRTSRWKPGTRTAYCNSGPAVAAYIVEKISGQRFEDYVKQNLFGPIGMKTATYFQPPADLTTTLYQWDGNTPFPYWNIIFRPAGAINASAEDMAAYLQFYLNRGVVNGLPILPSESIDRMEIPTRDWAAQAGLKTGYGLSNYWTINDGFVYHGHNGGVSGGITEMNYLKEFDIGYFFSVNSNSRVVGDISHAIRAYITRNLARPALPPAVAMSAIVEQYAGWYQSDSPRTQLQYPWSMPFDNIRLRFANGKMYSAVLSIPMREYEFESVTPTQFRILPGAGDKEAPSSVATDLLLPRNSEGLFMQGYGGQQTLKRIPTWLFVIKITLVAWVLLAVISIIFYAPFWMIAGLSRKRRRPQERWLRLWPGIALLSAIALQIFVSIGSIDFAPRLGQPSIWSWGVCFSSLMIGVTAVAGMVTWIRTDKQLLRPIFRWYSFAVTVPLFITAIYLAYWGWIGVRTWA